MRFLSFQDVSASLITTKSANNVVTIASKAVKLNYLLVKSLAKYASVSLTEILTDVKVKRRIIDKGKLKTL